MEPLKELLKHLNKLSRSILNELGKNEPSLEFLDEKLEERGTYINRLSNFNDIEEVTSLSSEERSNLKALFDEFTLLNENIQGSLDQILNRYKKELADATKQRKAEDGYRILKKPDISYY